LLKGLLNLKRASLGVQDVNPLIQAAIGRIQPLAAMSGSSLLVILNALRARVRVKGAG
jgi:hypothetical protein